MLEGIGIELIEILRKDNFNLTHLWLLENYNKGIQIDIPEVKALERRLYILDNELTERGKDYYYSLITENSMVKKVASKSDIDIAFDKWWGTRTEEGIYPSTDNFVYKGRTFGGVQKKNIKKEECKSEFRKIILSGEYSADEVLNGTRNHINIAKEQSLKKGQNQLSFITNSERYLKLRAFASFIQTEVMKKNERTTEEFSGTDF